ncbi:ribonuclease H-like domain-containing protein, partial [Catenaria anguillulae PL171]
MRKCARCGKSFDITAPLAAGSGGGRCTYHWGRTVVTKNSGDTLRVFSCCQGEMGKLGCTESVHVFREERVEYLHAVEAFVETPTSGLVRSPGKRALEIVALDCEMCYTSLGMEVCRVTVIDQWKRKIIDELVKPKGIVRDLNTRYSGIKSLEGAKKSLADIRSALCEVIDDQTILVGHGLENDLKALRLVHYLIVDTSELFRKHEADRKPSLKKLADSILARSIQQGGSEGHDSLEDA